MAGLLRVSPVESIEVSFLSLTEASTDSRKPLAELHIGQRSTDRLRNIGDSKVQFLNSIYTVASAFVWLCSAVRCAILQVVNRRCR